MEIQGKMEKTKSKTCTYPVTAAWVENGVKKSYATQLYRTGVYIIFNNDSSMQGSMEPKGMAGLAKKLKKSEQAGKITGLSFGSEISVREKNGFWEKEPDKQAEENPSVTNKVEALLKTGNTVNITDRRRNISYQWTIKEIDPATDTIVFTSTPQLTGLENMVKTKGDNNTCPLSVFRATVAVQLYTQK